MFTNGTPMWDLADYYDVGDYDDCDDGKGSHPPRKVQFFLTLFKRGESFPCSKIMLKIWYNTKGPLVA